MALFLFIVFLCVYLLTPNQLFSFDAVTNAIACEAGEPIRWFHANHPLYPFLASSGITWKSFWIQGVFDLFSGAFELHSHGFGVDAFF